MFGKVRSRPARSDNELFASRKSLTSQKSFWGCDDRGKTQDKLKGSVCADIRRMSRTTCECICVTQEQSISGRRNKDIVRRHARRRADDVCPIISHLPTRDSSILGRTVFARKPRRECDIAVMSVPTVQWVKSGRYERRTCREKVCNDKDRTMKLE